MNSLKFVMRLNALSCGSFGLLFVIWPHAVAAFLGDFPSTIIQLLGIGLIANGAHLVGSSLRKKLRKIEIIWFSLGDFAWWLATLALIAADFWITTTGGVFISFIIALAVAGLGVTQLWILGLQTHGNTHKQHLTAFAASWMALPLWVKIWLVLMNGVFLAAFALIPARIAEVVLISYFATAPLLAGQVGYDAGLRRILGLGHLVPWVPLLAWLLLLPNPTTYSIVLSIALVICLSFDIHDLWLFIKGNRKVIGAATLQAR